MFSLDHSNLLDRKIRFYQSWEDLNGSAYKHFKKELKFTTPLPWENVGAAPTKEPTQKKWSVPLRLEGEVKNPDSN